MMPKAFTTVGAHATLGRRLHDRYEFADITDRVRMPWRFLARRMAVDGAHHRR